MPNRRSRPRNRRSRRFKTIELVCVAMWLVIATIPVTLGVKGWTSAAISFSYPPFIVAMIALLANLIGQVQVLLSHPHFRYLPNSYLACILLGRLAGGFAISMGSVLAVSAVLRLLRDHYIIGVIFVSTGTGVLEALYPIEKMRTSQIVMGATWFALSVLTASCLMCNLDLTAFLYMVVQTCWTYSYLLPV